MRRIISLVLSLLLISQSALVYAQAPSSVQQKERPNLEFFSIPRLPASEIEEQCRFRFNRKVCEQYNLYGVDRQKAWDQYEYAFDNYKNTKYWAMSPSELYEEYEKVATDIGYLWSINPEYIDLKRGETITKIIIVWDITVIAVLAGTVIAPILEAHGFHLAAQISSVLPVETAGGGAVAGKTIVGRIINSLIRAIKALRTGHAWADLGISLAYMAVDTLFVEGAFYMYRATFSELATLQDFTNLAYAVQSRELLSEILDPKLSEEDQEELKKNEKEIHKLHKELKEALKQALEEEGWGEDPLIHRETVVTLYALEYIRAEMADMSDSMRYREAAVDTAQIYFSKNELTNLIDDRYALWHAIEEAYYSKLEESRERAKEIQERLDSSVLNLSGGTPYFRAGHM